ncbi:hypothetical protein [Mesorhizobium sp. Root172]|uniref:hypothetical protein n=1 Tax=Mesorhizobium sp. Root172 TaxID=1736481 RepID=UPI0006F3E54E|nr:hypothetical protein [Mesorhizobium sp. Root172]KRB22718.1 hypothetical protein ASE05_16180 [Mesorhizobium sp. Root172]
MTIAKLIETPADIDQIATRIAGQYLDAPISCSNLYRAVADALMAERASSQEEIARLTRERDEALRLADWSAVENNTIVNQVWDLLGGPDATREGGQSLVNRVKERLEEIARLRKALAVAVDQLSLSEPGDSRAVSDLFVALASVVCDCPDEKSWAIIDEAALASKAGAA